MTVSAKHTRNGWYAVAITIEDSPKQAISLNDSVLIENDVISSIPLQVLESKYIGTDIPKNYIRMESSNY